MQPNRLLYRDFPPELRNAYGDAVRARDWSSRHKGLLDFAEAALGYLASLSLSDYRTRCTELVGNVESLIEKSRNKPLTMGRVLDLFRVSAKAMPDPLVPRVDGLSAAQLDDVRRFAAAVGALDAAVAGLSPGASSAAIDVSHYVKDGLGEEGDRLDWWEAWQRLIAYRNRVVHSGRDPWPTGNEHYWNVMGPLLHDAIVELLTHSAVADSILAHPVGTITLLLRSEAGDFVHLVCGEERGVLFEEEVVAAMSVTERWAEDWAATTATSYILDPAPEGWSIHSPFWDLRNGLPPAMGVRPGDSSAKPGGISTAGTRTKRPGAREGQGTAPGTCGEFIQGILPDGTPFHVTCPINKSANVVAKLRPARELSVIGLSEHHRKLGLAIEYTVERLDLGPTEVTIRHWSDIDIGKGMGSSTADVLSGIRAVANAAGERLDVAEEGALAARVESSDGSMYPGIAAVNHKTCELVKAWDWYPEFVIVMLVPHDSVDTQSIGFAGQEQLATEYEVLLENMDRAISERSLANFAAQSTRSAGLNERFLLSPYCCNLSDRLDEFGALGVNVGHTGTVCGLLFANTEAGRLRASEACFAVRREFDDLKDVKVVTTPHCAGQSEPSEEDGSQADQAEHGK